MTIMTVAVQDVIEYDAFSQVDPPRTSEKSPLPPVVKIIVLSTFTPVSSALHLFSAYLLLLVQ